jgi:hypothetical protein
MASHKKKNHGNSPKIDSKIHIDDRKIPRRTQDPLSYEMQNPAWSFKHISKEKVWSFKPISFISESNNSLDTKCILSLLSSYESMTWSDIKRKTHDNSKSSNHFIEDFNTLHEDAKNKIRSMKIENLFSLSLGSTTRIYGILESRVLEILWFDDNHGDNDTCVCRSNKKHT